MYKAYIQTLRYGYMREFDDLDEAIKWAMFKEYDDVYMKYVLDVNNKIHWKQLH